MGEYFSIEDVCRGIDEVTPQDIGRLARKLLKEDRRSVVVLGPRPSKQVMQRFRPLFPGRYNK